MKNIVNLYIEKFKADHRKIRRMFSVLLILALIVTVDVFWQLHSTGIAITNETYCGLEEHQHTDDCYEEVLICGLEEDEKHTHDESCYEKQLVCGLEEHVHTIACMSDENADVETADDWEATLPKLTGVWADDVAAIAASQLGYTESTDNFTLDEDGVTCKGYTRYGAWAGNEYGDWDAMFASFCLYYSGISTETVPESTGAYAWSLKLQDAGLYVNAEDYTPCEGDLVFFDKNDDGKVDAVGIVIAFSDTELTVIEGDSNDMVEENIYSGSDEKTSESIDTTEEPSEDIGVTEESTESTDPTEESDDYSEIVETISCGFTSVVGYVNISAVYEEYQEAVAVETDTFTASDGDVTVTVTAPADALPNGAELSVTIFDEDSDDYTAAGETVSYDADDEDTGMAALDITFYVDGVEVEPTEAVTVSLDASTLIPEDADVSTIEVQHLTETEEGIEAELVADAEGGVDTDTAMIEFEVESFSTFTITWGSWNQSISMTATTYLYNTTTVIGSGSTSLTGTSGTAFDLTSNNSSLEIDGYTLVSASVTYGNTTHNNVTALTVTINNGRYTCTYTDSSGTGTLYSNTNRPSTVTISLYYVPTPGISISASGSDDAGYTLSATTENTGTYTYTEAEWSVNNSSLATLTDNGDGTVTLNWTSAATTGDSVTVTVTSTTTDYTENIVTVTDSYTLTNGLVTYSIHTTYGNNSTTAAGANVALLDSSGNIVASGTTDSNGDVTFTVVPGTYSIEATYTVTGTGGGMGSSSTIYHYGGSLTISDSDTGTTVNLTKDNTYTYDHVDIRVDGTYSLTVETDSGTTTTTLATYVYVGSDFTVTLPDGSVLSGTATYSSSEGEYRLTGQSISDCWDTGEESDYQKFSLDVSILVSLTALRNAGLTDSEIENIFGVSLTDSGDLVTYSSATNGVPAGTYIIVELANYHPTSNVCEGKGNSRGYDFNIDLSSALSYLTDQLMVYKYVIDEDGNVVSSTEDSTSFDFTLTKSDNTVNKTTSLVSGGSSTFSDIEAGYYYITESVVDGYVPVTVTVDAYGNITLADAGYVQYVQAETKEDGSIPSVTFYNLKLSDDTGAVILNKVVNDDAAAGTYSGDTFTFKLFTDDGNGTYTASSLNDIAVTASENKEFYLEAGTYTIVELGSTLTGDDTQTVSINGTTLTRTVAGSDDPYGLTAGTVYYVGEITVTAGETLTYTATNTYTRTITIQKVDSNDSTKTLTGAEFYLYYESSTEWDNEGNPLKYYVVLDSDNAVGSWVSDTAYASKLVVDADGLVTVSGLSAGIYYLEEVTSPDGYNKLSEPIKITIGNSIVITEGNDNYVSLSTDSDGEVLLTVENTPGVILPLTGSTGTVPYTLIGLFLCAGAALWLIIRRRRRQPDPA